MICIIGRGDIRQPQEKPQAPHAFSVGFCTYIIIY